MSPQRVLAFALAARLLAACSSDEDWRPDWRPPLGAAGKPIIDLPTGPAVGDEWIIEPASGVSVREVEAIVAAAGGVVTYHATLSGVFVARFRDVEAAARAAQVLRADERVVDIAYNHVTAGTGIETSPGRELQWNLYAMTLDPFSQWGRADGVTVAVLDTGIAYEAHADALGTYALAPDLAGVTFVPGWDFVNDDAHPNDDQGHGTHVTAVIAASSGIASLAPGATILPVKVLDASNIGTELALAEGLRFAADQGADVINLSLSFAPTYFPSRILQSAVDHASQHRVLLVAAAGNHGEEIVAFPAAFRDVIAVGASDLSDDAVNRARDDARWADTLGSLTPAPYTNRSHKLDVLAPAGTIEGDLDGDGYPEAVVAQSFAPGDPTNFGYYFHAGTSQAAAQVSGLAAQILARTPELSPHEVRALLVENAKPLGAEILSADGGGGFVRARKTLAAADNPHAADPRPRFFANVAVTLHEAPSGVVARAHVEVLEEDGEPAPGLQVHGMFTGAAFGGASGTTDSRGLVELESAPLAGTLLVAFHVDAVTDERGGRVVFDRPRGFTRIDSASLEMLSRFGASLPGAASGAGIETSPGGSSSSAAGGFASGAGIETSPGRTYPIDPARTPLTIAYDETLFAGTSYRRTLLLPNFSWGLATAPMAVAADEAWFLATFPDAAARRVVSYGRGFADSAFLFDERSFPVALAVDASTRIPLLLLTFTSGVGTRPVASAIETSPGRSIRVDTFYGGLDPALAAAYEELLARWYAMAAGVETSPGYDPSAGYSRATFDHLARVATSYLAFAPLPIAAPAASYGETLRAAALSLAPVSPLSDGEGVGVSVWAP